MLNSQYKDYHYGVWGVYVNSQVDKPIIIEGRYKDVVEVAKTMDGTMMMDPFREWNIARSANVHITLKTFGLQNMMFVRTE